MSTKAEDGFQSPIGCTCELLPVVQSLAEKYEHVIGPRCEVVPKAVKSLQRLYPARNLSKINRKYKNRFCKYEARSLDEERAGDGLDMDSMSSKHWTTLDSASKPIRQAGGQVVLIPNRTCPVHSKRLVSNFKLMPFFKISGNESLLSANFSSMINFWQNKMNCNRGSNTEESRNSFCRGRPSQSKCVPQANSFWQTPSLSHTTCGQSVPSGQYTSPSGISRTHGGRIAKTLKMMKTKKIFIPIGILAIVLLIALGQFGVQFMQLKQHHQQQHCGLTNNLWNALQKQFFALFN